MGFTHAYGRTQSHLSYTFRTRSCHRFHSSGRTAHSTSSPSSSSNNKSYRSQKRSSQLETAEEEHAEDDYPFSRRDAITSAIGSLSGAAALPHLKADAFPSPNLETLQESAATSSSGRCRSEAGISALRNPAIYRGAATDKAVRTVYSLDGLLPARRLGLQEEVERASLWIERCCSPLQKYQALMTVKETNRDCFYGLLQQNIETLIPIVYTPTVGEACQEWSHLLHRPTGLYISLNDAGNLKRIVSNWPEDEVKLVVITDGERILGLGDLGANGLGIPVGKAIMHTIGGIHPRLIIPIAVDVGCNNSRVRADKLYIGAQQERARGPRYDELMDELLAALRERYGQSLLVHWEDLSSKNSYRLLAKARSEGISTFNDDIESTAAAVVAAILGATQLQGVPPLEKQTVVLVGAGQANIGTARLLLKAMQAEGLSEADARARLWLFDSKGLVYNGRESGGITKEKQEFARPNERGSTNRGKDLAQAIREIKPTALIGATAKQGAFDQDVIQALSKGIRDTFTETARPIVLALSNPNTVAECTAEDAHNWSDGSAVFASGTTFPSFKAKDGSSYVPSQANNSLIFPGVGLGCIASGAILVTDDMMLAAARAVNSKLTEEELGQTSILPSTVRLREVALSVAAAVALTAVENMVASSTGTDILNCLPLESKDLEDSFTMKQAEACIAKIRYDPFANELDLSGIQT